MFKDTSEDLFGFGYTILRKIICVQVLQISFLHGKTLFMQVLQDLAQDFFSRILPSCHKVNVRLVLG